MKKISRTKFLIKEETTSLTLTSLSSGNNIIIAWTKEGVKLLTPEEFKFNKNENNLS